MCNFCQPTCTGRVSANSLISCAGVTRRWELLSHARKVGRHYHTTALRVIDYCQTDRHNLTRPRQTDRHVTCARQTDTSPVPDRQTDTTSHVLDRQTDRHNLTHQTDRRVTCAHNDNVCSPGHERQLVRWSVLMTDGGRGVPSTIAVEEGSQCKPCV